MSTLLDQLAAQQAQVLHRRQFRDCGITRSAVVSQLKARRWQTVGPVAIVLHNGPLTYEQQRWAAVLSSGGHAALAGRTALELGGLTRWESKAVQVLVPVGGHTPTLPGIAVEMHQTRRDEAYRLRVFGSPPRTTVERSALDAASWSNHPRTAGGLLAAVVQQRLTTAQRLLEELEKSGPIRHRRLMWHTLQDIAGGAHALSEIDIGKLCRSEGLMITARQVFRLDALGQRRYLDGIVTGPDGKEVAFEVDGAIHLMVLNYWEDMQRANELVIAKVPQLRFPSLAVRVDGPTVVDQFRRALQ
jgi:hypothetical protein